MPIAGGIRHGRPGGWRRWRAFFNQMEGEVCGPWRATEEQAQQDRACIASIDQRASWDRYAARLRKANELKVAVHARERAVAGSSGKAIAKAKVRANVKFLGKSFNGPSRGTVQERNADTNALKELLRAATSEQEAQVLHSAWIAREYR